MSTTENNSDRYNVICSLSTDNGKFVLMLFQINTDLLASAFHGIMKLSDDYDLLLTCLSIKQYESNHTHA